MAKKKSDEDGKISPYEQSRLTFHHENTELAKQVTKMKRRFQQNLTGMGTTTFSFAKETDSLVEKDGTLLPSYLNKEEFHSDFEEIEEIRKLRDELYRSLDLVNSLHKMKADTVSGNCQAVYQNVKKARDHGIAGMNAVFEKLKALQPHGRGRRRQSASDAAVTNPAEGSDEL
jgi:hypothetical protein